MFSIRSTYTTLMTCVPLSTFPSVLPLFEPTIHSYVVSELQTDAIRQKLKLTCLNQKIISHGLRDPDFSFFIAHGAINLHTMSCSTFMSWQCLDYIAHIGTDSVLDINRLGCGMVRLYNHHTPLKQHCHKKQCHQKIQYI